MSDIKMLHLYSCELDASTREVTLPTPLMHQDAYADVFRIHVTRGGLDLQLDGMTVRAWLYLAATGETMLLEGSADGSMVMVTLEPECYLFPGYATLAIQLQQGEECRTLIKIDLAIKRTCTDTVIDPSNVLPTLPELLAQIAAMEQGTAAANAAAEAANTAAANAQEFIVTVTTPAYIVDGDMSGIKADKTYAEIQAAINAGKTPVVKLKTSGQAQTKILHLAMIAPVSIVFREHTQDPSTYNTAGSARCTFLSTGGIIWDAAVFHTVPDNGADGQVLIHKGDSTYEWRDPSAIAGVAPAIIPTATGSIVTITDGAARPAVEVISHIEPVQAGSGDPSPDNVRPISGRDSVTAQRTGANLAYNAATSSHIGGLTFTVSDDGTITVDGTANETVFYHVGTFTLKPGSYRMSGTPLGGSASTYYLYFDTYFGARIIDNGEGVAFDAGEELTIALTIRINQGATVSKLIFRPGITHKDYEGSYEPYQGQTLSAALPETVYGGKLDWKTGVLTVGMYKKSASDFPTIVCGVNADGVRYADLLHNGVHRSKQYGDCVSNVYKSLPSGTTYSGAMRLFTNEITVYDERFTNEDVARALLEEMGFEVVYELDEPYTIQLTPQQLDTLKGHNNVWSDCGDTTISYVADTQLYIDNKLASISEALLNK